MAFSFKQLFGKSPEKLEHKEQTVNMVVIQKEPVGSSGTEIYNGYSSEEYLTALRDDERADVFDKMRRSDPQVKMCLSAVKNPIRRATVEFEPGGDNPSFQEHADFAEYAIMEAMVTPWRKFLREALTAIEFGFSTFEITHKNVLESKFGPFTGINRLGWRSPKTIERFNVDEDGNLSSISQYAHGDLQRLVDIDAKFLMHIGLDVEGSNYEGISLLRPCYGNWFRKNNYLKINAIGAEKFAVPTPIAKVPAGKEGTAEYTNMKNALAAYTTHQSNYLIMPEGWEIDLKTNTYDPDKLETSIDNEDKRMVKAFMANFLELGMSSTGSYALSNDLSDFFLAGIEYVADEIAESLNDRVIKPLIIMNYGEQPVYPKIKFSGISDKAGKELAEVLEKLASKKYITPDDKLEESLRKRYKLPEMSLEGQRKPEEDKGLFNLSEKINHAIRNAK